MTQENLYLNSAGLMQVETAILAMRSFGDENFVALRDNLYRPAGGGEPADRGTLIIEGGQTARVNVVRKCDKLTWVNALDRSGAIPVGARVLSSVDSQYRNQKRRLHTLMHVVLAVVLRRLGTLEVTHAEISVNADEASLEGISGTAITSAVIAEIDAEVRQIVLQARSVQIDEVASLDVARERFGAMFRFSSRHRLSGRIRLVVIDDLDANPCSGCHYDTTNVGPFELVPFLDAGQPTKFSARLRCTSAWRYWYAERASS